MLEDEARLGIGLGRNDFGIGDAPMQHMTYQLVQELRWERAYPPQPWQSDVTGVVHNPRQCKQMLTCSSNIKRLKAGFRFDVNFVVDVSMEAYVTKTTCISTALKTA
jgi:hypothetical protein